MLNEKCEFYPCHKKLESCDFCFCPIYPCHIDGTGGKMYKEVWDCSECTILHDLTLMRIIKNKITYEVKRVINQNVQKRRNRKKRK